MSASEMCRWIIGGSWIYHGLVPKIIQIAPLEQAMTKKFGFGEEVSYLITKAVVFRILCHFFTIDRKEMTHDQTNFRYGCRDQGAA
ncbi:hypothetical protein [Microbulbifer aggregans]|uniref:hypothetical protein n=1 Tax=Microbulbifer aggregans TaxID=1769779 RepID=UPI001CFD4A63|nr:hypothetical protein [Microbulbifer aggregans]